MIGKKAIVICGLAGLVLSAGCEDELSNNNSLAAPMQKGVRFNDSHEKILQEIAGYVGLDPVFIIQVREHEANYMSDVSVHGPVGFMQVSQYDIPKALEQCSKEHDLLEKKVMSLELQKKELENYDVSLDAELKNASETMRLFSKLYQILSKESAWEQVKTSPEVNMFVGVMKAKWLYDFFEGDYKKVAAAYVAGEDEVCDALRSSFSRRKVLAAAREKAAKQGDVSTYVKLGEQLSAVDWKSRVSSYRVTDYVQVVTQGVPNGIFSSEDDQRVLKQNCPALKKDYNRRRMPLKK